jgi:hypothetical protein
MTVALFADANQYLNLYQMIEGRKLLSPLEEQRRYILCPAR